MRRFAFWESRGLAVCDDSVFSNEREFLKRRSGDQSWLCGMVLRRWYKDNGVEN